MYGYLSSLYTAIIKLWVVLEKLSYRDTVVGLPLVIWAGIGEGHCRGTFELEFFMEAVDSGLSSDEHRCDNGRKHLTNYPAAKPNKKVDLFHKISKVKQFFSAITLKFH